MSLESTVVPPRLVTAKNEPLPWESGLLYGPTGSGKTYRALQCLASVRGTFVSLPRFIGEMRELAVREDDDRWFAVRRMRRAEHLVLDDLGAEKLTEFAAETLYELLDYLYGDLRPVIVTSNLDPEGIGRIHGDRIASRVLGFGPERFVGGADRRVFSGA